MKAAGLITEYNPMHKGHLYHLQKAKEFTGADTLVAVMSGDYVQRGEPAIFDKFTRAEAAVNAGVNLVVELPAKSALSSAEHFAKDSVFLLSCLKVSDIVFGSECGDIQLLNKIAAVLHIADKPSPTSQKDRLISTQYNHSVQKLAKNGVSYAKAREQAITDILGSAYGILLKEPNNILGIEYCRAILSNHAAITPYTVKRVGNGYNDNCCNSDMPSAAAIRKKIITCSQEPFITCNDYSGLLTYKMAQLLYHSGYHKKNFYHQIKDVPDMNEAIANRIFNETSKNAGHFLHFDTFAQNIKPKQYTLSRIKRILMRILLDCDVVSGNTPKDKDYIRILGFDQNGKEYLSWLKKQHINIPIVTKAADYQNLMYNNLHASDIYSQILHQKYNIAVKNDVARTPYIKF